MSLHKWFWDNYPWDHLCCHKSSGRTIYVDHNWSACMGRTRTIYDYLFFILFYFIIGFIAHTKLQIIGTRVGNEVNIVWLRVYRLSLPIA